MSRRSWITLAAIAALVVALGVLRGGGAERGSRPAPGPASTNTLPAILDFGRGTCLACKKMMPVLDEVRAAYRGVVDVHYLDLAEAESNARAREYGVKLIPTQVFLAADGKVLFRHEGFLPREAIERKLVELGWVSTR
ncbi:MAG: thioredoxin family protein [Planctomycetes bacterium]|nr:thioredoxin family protein [Planctomycetota bacterium]